jgi:stage II sporulation protein D
MRTLLLLTTALLLPASAAAQTAEVTIRLYWLQQIETLRLAPQGRELRLRLCDGCEEIRVGEPVEVRVADGRLRAGEHIANGDTIHIAGAYRIDVSGHPPLTLAHRLTLRAEGNGLAVSVRLPLEAYVSGVLAGESAGFTSEESLKAMAVAVRSYAVHYRGRHRAEGFDLCDTTHCQDLRLTAVSQRLRAAAEATEAELLWYEGLPAATYYHRDCGGTSEAAENAWAGRRIAYLRQQADAYCVARGRAQWRSELTAAEIRRALAEAGFEPPHQVRHIEITSRTPSGRAARVRVEGSASRELRALDFRLAVGRAIGWERIRSDFYEVESRGDRFLLRGYGAGHGVGLCQAGAAQMGELGKNYDEILRFYYPGAERGLTAQGLRWNALAGERVELLTTRPRQEGFLVELADRSLRELEQLTGWRLAARPQMRVYPTVEIYRNATGRPGWEAASTRGHVIRMQPAETLRAAGTLDETLRHELLHLLIEGRAHPTLPLWFREGIVLALAAGPARAQEPSPGRLTPPAEIDRALRAARNEAQLRQAYAAARKQVNVLIAQHEIAVVLGWVERGLPAELLAALSRGR